jgi:2-haloacid dehalogenase
VIVVLSVADPGDDNIHGRAGRSDAFEALLSVEDAPGWKPAQSAYGYAGQASGTDPSQMMLVAVHPWDIHGAARAGLQTAWINRAGATYPAYFTPPDHTVTALTELPAVMTGKSA